MPDLKCRRVGYKISCDSEMLNMFLVIKKESPFFFLNLYTTGVISHNDKPY